MSRTYSKQTGPLALDVADHRNLVIVAAYWDPVNNRLTVNHANVTPQGAIDLLVHGAIPVLEAQKEISHYGNPSRN